MAHFGAICFPGTGHLNPLTALARTLQNRGHRFTIFQIADVEQKIRAAGVDYAPIGQQTHPRGTLAALDQELGRLKGIAALRFTLKRVKDSAAMVLRDAPPAVRAAGVDLLVVDQAELAGSSVAEHLGIPFATVIFFPPVLRDAYVPPFNFGWRYGTGPYARLRNHLGYRLLYRVVRPTFRMICAKRREWRLPPIRHIDELSSQKLQVTQMPAAFDFPRRRVVPHLHHTGPFVDDNARAPVDFPWERLDGDGAGNGQNSRPLIYASMGTLQNGSEDIFRCIAQACAGLDARLVMSLGGGLDPAALGELPGDPIVVRFAPQLQLLKRATLTITHAGLNTTLESLAFGLPMVAIPVGNDQPGVASRIEWSGAGRAIPFRRATVPRLRVAVTKVLSDPAYRAAAQRLQKQIQEANGLNRAADLLEGAALGAKKSAMLQT